MSLDVHADNEIAWVDPTTSRTFRLLLGNDDGSGSFEVLLGEVDSPPTNTQLKDLHGMRLNKRNADLVVALQFGNSVWLFGPEKDRSSITLKAESAARAIQTCLDEPDSLSAYKRYVTILDAQGTTDMPGVRNRGLFASHHLRENVPKRRDWAQLTEAARPLVRLRHRELIAQLGYSVSDEVSDALVLCDLKDDQRAIAVLLNSDENFESSSSRFPSSPVATGLGVAQRLGAPWLIVLRKEQIRLYPGRDGVGVGQKGQVETYLELDLAMLDDDHVGLLTLVFSAEALGQGGSTELLLTESAKYAADLGDRLRNRVYEKVVPSISTAIAEQFLEQGQELDSAGLQKAYSVTLKILFRLLFQAYAEDRGLLPAGRNERYDANSLKTIAQRDIDTPVEQFSDAATIWNDLIQVWDAIDQGSPLWQVPAYNGGLFGSDPIAHPEGHLIRSLRIPDSILGPALQGLLIDFTDEGVNGPVDFRSLSVREFGTIYEGLLESSLSLAPVDITIKDNTWVPASDGEEVHVQTGRPYFHSSSGERKATGSYFTPKFVVDHLVERAVDPVLTAHLDRIADYLKQGDSSRAYLDFFDFRVADLAMGSGHFLVAAVDRIEMHMRSFLADSSTQVPGVVDELARLRASAIEALGRDEAAIEEIEDASLLRRQIARRCIYGLDINPLAVELSRLALWIHTFVPGLPMSSLDHGLVCANSLTGIGSVDEALDALQPNRKTGDVSFAHDAVLGSLRGARELLIDAANASEANKSEVSNSRELAQKARDAASVAKNVFDVAVAANLNLVDAQAVLTAEEFDELARTIEVRELVTALNCAHMPFLFPEVFLRENPGFDVLIGNPPFDKVKIDEQRWWGLHLPGIRALPSNKKAEAIASYQAERPDLLAQYQEDVGNVNFYRKALLSGPFPGMGSGGDPDLYAGFSWRNWQLVRVSGRIGMVLPRSALAASALSDWREDVLNQGIFEKVYFLNNVGGWVFDGPHNQMTFALTVIARGTLGAVSYCGPLSSQDELRNADMNIQAVPLDEFKRWTLNKTFPLLPNVESFQAFRKMKLRPNFTEIGFEIELRGNTELHATNDKPLLDFDLKEAKGRTPVFGGSSFNIWDVDFGGPWAYVRDNESFRQLMLDKFRRAQNNSRSAYKGFELPIDAVPYDFARVAYRWITNQTNTRTTVVCLLPPGTPTVNSAPTIVFKKGGVRAEAFVLGVMSSRMFDWLSRRLVEGNLTFEVLADLPIPIDRFGTELADRCVEIAGRLASVDARFADWANEVGVQVGSVKSESEKQELIAELDAVVAHLYGLDTEDVEHVFRTFHRGWDYQQHLEKVSDYMDKIGPND
jgi:hypothetical protein